MQIREGEHDLRCVQLPLVVGKSAHCMCGRAAAEVAAVEAAAVAEAVAATVAAMAAVAADTDR